MSKTSKSHVRAAVFYLAVLMTAPPSAIAQGVVHSHPPTNGIYAEIGMDMAKAALSGAKVRYCFLTTNELGAKIAYPQAQYFCRVGLLDARGSNLPPSSVGRAMGNHFSDLKTFSYDRLETIDRVGSNPAHPRIEWIYNGSCAAKELPALEALFVIPRPGKYNLRLEFQVFEQVHQGTNFLYNLIILPAVDVPVVKR